MVYFRGGIYKITKFNPVNFRPYFKKKLSDLAVFRPLNGTR